MNPIYDYIDYRCFLKERFSESKRKNPLFSYRSFNRLAGVKSSGFLKLVMDGKRNLADEGIRMISRGFRLNDSERKYFESLVRFNQAAHHEEKDRHFRELSQYKKFIAAKPLTAAQYHLFSHWYYVAILELVRIESKKIKGPDWLINHIRPRIALRDLNRALKDLKQLGLLEDDKRGGFQRKESMLTTEDETHALSVANFHVQMSQLAAQSITQDRAENREFSTLTIATSERGFQRLREEMRKFRKRLHSMLEQETDIPKTLVSHINLQLFRLSETGGQT